MKKIAFISWDMTVLGGINQVIVTLANEFAKQYDVHIVSLTRGNDQMPLRVDEPIHDVFFVQETACRGREVTKGGKDKLNQYLQENKIDILFLMGFQVSLPVCLMTMGKKYKKVFCEHEALMSRWHERKLTVVRYLSALLCDKVVTLTEQNALDYCRMFHLPKKKVEYIYNSISPSVIEQKSEAYDRNSKTILSVGRFSPEKQYDVLLDVAQPVLEKHSDWNWIIYGTGETFQDIKDDICTRGLAERIILKGETKEIATVYKQGALFVLTSKREGLPLVLLEAKANHLPCISFDIISGPSEMIRNQTDGFLIPAFDKEGMINAVDKLILDEQLRIQMAEEADKNLDKFSMPVILQQWIKLIETL